jgi:hypothetical protein
MRLQRLTNYLLQHRWLALLLTFITTFVPVFGVVGILFAALVTLRKGIVEGGIITLAATLPYVISYYVSGNQEGGALLMLWAAVGVAILSNILTWAFAVMLRRHASWSQILQVAALIGVLLISIIHLIYPDIADWWGGQLQSYYKQASALTGMLKNATTSSPDMQFESINFTKQYATGLMTAAVLFNGILQLIVARWWQALVFSPGLLRRELHGIRLSQLAGILFVFSLVLSYLGNSVVLDIMPVVYMLFGGAGLSLIHYVFGLIKSSTRWFWIWLMYVTLIFALPTSIVLVGLIALFDIWLDIRKRVKKS